MDKQTWRGRCVLTTMLVALLLAVTPASAAPKVQPQPVVTDGVSVQSTHYQLIAVHSGKCLDVENFSPNDGTRVQQWTCLPGHGNQLWRLEWAGTGYQLVAVHSGKCLDVENFSPNDGARVQQWTCLPGHGNQLWQFVWAGNGYQLVAVHSGKCLDVENFSPNDGTRLQQWTCLPGHGNQLWQLNPV
ncbi:MAG: hypothetical protein OHK0022_32910 [Roseiflexaceae bacterium]